MAIATEPQKWVRPLGESADVNSIDDEYKGKNSISFKELFPPITQLPLSAGGICPDRKDTNALFKILGDYIWYAQHGGIPAYSTDFDYHAGALVSYNDKCYICIAANGAGTTVKAPTDTDYWAKFITADEGLSQLSVIATQPNVSNLKNGEGVFYPAYNLLNGSSGGGSGEADISGFSALSLSDTTPDISEISKETGVLYPSEDAVN